MRHRVPLTLALLCLACGAYNEDHDGSTSACAEPVPATSAPAQLTTLTGTLHGTWMTPEGCPPFPTVVFHVGSGPTNRDGNSTSVPGTNDAHLRLAQALQASGIASLRYDKRGVAQSIDAVAREEDLTIEVYVQDLVEWINILHSESTISSIAVFGHSEGALIGMSAVRRSEVDAFISAAGPGRPVAEILREQVAKTVGPELLGEFDRIVSELRDGRTVGDVPDELAPLFRESVQPYLMSMMFQDPTDLIGSLAIPATVIGGGMDVQVPITDAQRLAEAQPDAALYILETMTHELKDGSWGARAAREDPAVPLADGLVEIICQAAAENCS